MTSSKEIRQANEFEIEFNKRKNKIKDLSIISHETVELVNFVVKFDRDRYMKKLEHFFVKNKLLLEEMAYSLAGVSSIYDKVLGSNNIDTWQDYDYLMPIWQHCYASKTEWAIKKNKCKALQFYGKQLAIVGLMRGCLWYDLESDPLRVHSDMLEVKRANKLMEEDYIRQIASRQKNE